MLYRPDPSSAAELKRLTTAMDEAIKADSTDEEFRVTYRKLARERIQLMENCNYEAAFPG